MPFSDFERLCMPLNVGLDGFRLDECAPSLSGVNAIIYNEVFGTLRHVLRLGAVIPKMAFDVIHTFGLGICKRVLEQVYDLVLAYGLVPDHIRPSKRKRHLEGLVKKVDARMRADCFNWMRSSRSETYIRKVF